MSKIISVSVLTISISILIISKLAAQEIKSGCECCTPGTNAQIDIVADMDKRIADLEKQIARKGDFLLHNVHAGPKRPIRARECLILLKKDRDAAARNKDDKPSPDALVWVGKRHVRYSELPKAKQATAQVCDHNGYRWITVVKTQWRIKNCSEIPGALQPNPLRKFIVNCCQGEACCGGDGHCATSGCCKKNTGCCEKSKDGKTLCNSKCGCILGCHG